eukprot:g8435.t1
MEESHVRACRILILGDGNFSFSLALARALPPSFEIVATSFDGPVDLLRKYPESPGIVAALRSLGVTVLHNVDATALDARVIKAEASSADGCGGPTPQRQQYEHVIFNHPHTGTEDMRRHRSFLGHFFHAVAHSTCIEPGTATTGVNTSVETCADGVGGGGGDGGGGDGATASGVADGYRGTESVLSPGGAIHVTLALDQPERWGLQEQAARHGFSLAHRRRFPAELIDGYMTKRHQTGRSFQQRVQNSETLSFVWASSRKADEGDPAMAGFGGGCRRSCSRGSGEPKTRATGGCEVAAATLPELGPVDNATEQRRRDGVEPAQGGTGASASSTNTSPPWLWPDVNMSGGKPGLNADGHGGGSNGGSDPGASAVDEGRRSDANDANRNSGERNGEATATATSAATVLLPEVCERCGKRYKSSQALRTHVRQFHELGQEGGVPLAAKKEKPCPHCGRMFTSRRALDQHVTAKHSGNHVDIKPDWFVGSIYHLEAPPPASNTDNSGNTGEEEVANRNSTATAAISDHRRLGVAASTQVTNPNASTETVEPGTAGLALEAKPTRTTDDNNMRGVFQECDVCGFWFASPADAQQHLDNLRPPIEGAVIRYDCRTCAKDFGSRRALLQHANFCGGGGGGGRGGAEAGRA